MSYDNEGVEIHPMEGGGMKSRKVGDTVVNPHELIEALTSGDYTKGVGRLGDADYGFCCLGVAAHLAERKGLMPNGYRSGDTYLTKTGSYGDFYGAKTPEWAPWLTPEVQKDLTHMNDVSFTWTEAGMGFRWSVVGFLTEKFVR